MGGAVRLEAERPLIAALRRWPRHSLRAGAALLAALAIGVVWQEGAAARAAVRAEADRRAAMLLTGYLTTVVPMSGAAGDARLLSTVSALVSANFWNAGAQVWLDRTPLLPADTNGTMAAVAPLLSGDGTRRGAVAVWESVPGSGDRVIVTVSVTLALAAIGVAALAGFFARQRRMRTLLTGVTVAVVAIGVAGQAGAVARAEAAAIDAGLLRSRRVIEVTAVGRRLGDETIARLIPGIRALAIPARPGTREPAVVRDSAGAWVIAVAAPNRAWQLIDPGWLEVRLGAVQRILGFGILALFATLAAAALPPDAGYLNTSRSDPRPPT